MSKTSQESSTTTSPGQIRNAIEMLQAGISELEKNLAAPISKGVTALVEVNFELAEASDALHRACDKLDENYKSLG